MFLTDMIQLNETVPSHAPPAEASANKNEFKKRKKKAHCQSLADAYEIKRKRKTSHTNSKKGYMGKLLKKKKIQTTQAQDSSREG